MSCFRHRNCYATSGIVSPPSSQRVPFSATLPRVLLEQKTNNAQLGLCSFRVLKETADGGCSRHSTMRRVVLESFNFEEEGPMLLISISKNVNGIYYKNISLTNLHVYVCARFA